MRCGGRPGQDAAALPAPHRYVGGLLQPAGFQQGLAEQQVGDSDHLPLAVAGKLAGSGPARSGGGRFGQCAGLPQQGEAGVHLTGERPHASEASHRLADVGLGAGPAGGGQRLLAHRGGLVIPALVMEGAAVAQ